MYSNKSPETHLARQRVLLREVEVGLEVEAENPIAYTSALQNVRVARLLPRAAEWSAYRG